MDKFECGEKVIEGLKRIAVPTTPDSGFGPGIFSWDGDCQTRVRRTATEPERPPFSVAASPWISRLRMRRAGTPA